LGLVAKAAKAFVAGSCIMALFFDTVFGTFIPYINQQHSSNPFNNIQQNGTSK